MSLTSDIQALNTFRAKIASLEAKIHSARSRELAGLPATYGFDSVDSFVAAVRAASGTGPKGRGRPAKAAVVSSSASTPKAGRRRRGKITPEMKADLKARVAKGETGVQIAKALGISLPSVHNVKKELGLTKSRK